MWHEKIIDCNQIQQNDIHTVLPLRASIAASASPILMRPLYRSAEPQNAIQLPLQAFGPHQALQQMTTIPTKPVFKR